MPFTNDRKQRVMIQGINSFNDPKYLNQLLMTKHGLANYPLNLKYPPRLSIDCQIFLH